MTTPIVSMREALSDPALLGTVLSGDSWRPWRILLTAMNGEPLLPDELPVFQELSGRESPPSEPLDEFWGLIGRRGGKSRAMATRAVYKSALCDHSAVIASGERPVVLFISANQKQSGVAFNYCAGIFDSVPLLQSLVTHKTADTISLNNGVDLEIRAANRAGIRGVTAIEILADEVAHWIVGDDAANSDASILEAARPSLATTGGMLLAITSPYARRGQAYEQWQKNFGPDGDPRILVVRAPSRTMNSSLRQSVVDRAMERDAASARAEYLAEWRDDIESFITADVVDACIASGRTALPPGVGDDPVCFLDVSGGVHDSHVCAIAVRHPDTDKAVIAALHEIKSADTEHVVREFASLLREYGLGEAWSDRYGSRWVMDAFEREGIRLRYSPKSRSDIYINALHAMRSRRVELLDQPRLRNQLLALQRRTTTGGRDIVDHPSGAHDDVANAACGALVLAAEEAGRQRFWYGSLPRFRCGPLDPSDITENDWFEIRDRVVCGPQPDQT